MLHSCSSKQWWEFKHQLRRIFNSSQYLSFFQLFSFFSIILLSFISVLSFISCSLIYAQLVLYSAFLSWHHYYYYFSWYLSSSTSSHLFHLLCPLFYFCLLDWAGNKRWLYGREIFHLNVQWVNKIVKLILWSLALFLSIRQNKVKHNSSPQVKLRALSSARALLVDSTVCFAIITHNLAVQRLLLCCSRIVAFHFLPFKILQNILNDVSFLYKMHEYVFRIKQLEFHFLTCSRNYMYCIKSDQNIPDLFKFLKGNSGHLIQVKLCILDYCCLSCLFFQLYPKLLPTEIQYFLLFLANGFRRQKRDCLNVFFFFFSLLTDCLLSRKNIK